MLVSSKLVNTRLFLIPFEIPSQYMPAEKIVDIMDSFLHSSTRCNALMRSRKVSAGRYLLKKYYRALNLLPSNPIKL